MNKNYNILGVDPGTNILGYAILRVEGSTLSVPTVGIIKLDKFSDHQTKLKEIYLQLQEVIECYLPSQMAIEAPFFGKNVQSMLKLGRAQGVAIAAAITMGVDITEYAPKKIKVSITGNGNASKEQVAAMLQNILKIKLDMKKMDATDALAAAYTHYNQGSIKETTGRKYKDWKSYLKENPKQLK